MFPKKKKLSLDDYKTVATEWIKSNNIYEAPTNVWAPLGPTESNEDRMLQV
jgi:hypothetical protein